MLGLTNILWHLSKLKHFHLQKFLIYLFEKESVCVWERLRLREREICLLIHSQNGWNDQGWARPELGTRSFVWISYMVWVLALGQSSVAFPGTLVGRWVPAGGTQTGAYVACQHHEWFLNSMRYSTGSSSFHFQKFWHQLLYWGGREAHVPASGFFFFFVWFVQEQWSLSWTQTLTLFLQYNRQCSSLKTDPLFPNRQMIC